MQIYTYFIVFDAKKIHFFTTYTVLYEDIIYIRALSGVVRHSLVFILCSVVHIILIESSIYSVCHMVVNSDFNRIRLKIR